MPIGISDFKELVQGNYYFIDKTAFIHDILQDGSKVIVFTRPRRFGKTMNMSMLYYFLHHHHGVLAQNRRNFRTVFGQLEPEF